MSTVVTIAGSTVACPRPVLPVRLDVYRHRGGTPGFTFEVRDGQAPVDPDPYLGKEATVTIDGTLRFKGDVLLRDVDPPTGGGKGWVKRYTATGLRDRGDRIPHVDRNDGSDQSSYNLSSDNHGLEYRPSRAGRTIGEILRDVLEGPENAAALHAKGLGGYTSLTPPTLPSATLADLAALTHRPPGGVTFGGERLLNAVEGLVSVWAPNHRFDVEPSGVFRFRDQRTFTERVLTLGADPIDPTPLRRDLTPCFGRVVVKGQPIAEVAQCRLSLGHLTEAPFAHDGLTVAAAKAAWTPREYWQQDALDFGTCVCLSTTTVRVTSAHSTYAWSANFWDFTPTGRHGQLYLIDRVGTSIAMWATRDAVANTALVAGGTSDFTVAVPLPHLDFDRYELRGLAGGAANVWRTYGLPAWLGPMVAPQTSVPYAFKLANGQSATMTTSPMGSVMWSSSGNPPFQEVAVPVALDPAAGTATFHTPTWITAGNRPPTEVRVFVPYYSGGNTLVHPADVSGVPQFAGTAHAVEGRAETLTVTSRGWRDPANRANIQAYAEDLLDSVKDAVVEGVVVFKGLLADALTPGLALSLDGDGTAAWADARLPVVECQLEWITTPGVGLTYRQVMRCSNRRAHLSDEAFLQPDRTGITLDFGDGFGEVLARAMAGAKLADPTADLKAAAGLHSHYLASNAAAAEGAMDALADFGAGFPPLGGDGKRPSTAPTGPGVSIRADGDELDRAAGRREASRRDVDRAGADGAARNAAGAEADAAARAGAEGDAARRAAEAEERRRREQEDVAGKWRERERLDWEAGR